MADLERDYWEFLKLKRSYPGAGYIEIRTDWRERLPREVGQSAALLRDALADAGTLLDVGAGDRLYSEVTEALGLQVEYRSADLDEVYDHDYTDFLAIEDPFDAILMLELIEHLPLADGLSFFRHAYDLLTPGGVLVLSTPNAHHPNHVWRVEVTHVRPWPAPDLYAALLLTGFDRVRMFRQYNVGGPRRRLLKPVSRALHRLMDLDHAQTLLAFARKASGAT